LIGDFFGTHERDGPKSAAIGDMVLEKYQCLTRLQAGAFIPRSSAGRRARLCRTAATQWKRLSLTSERLGCSEIE
jgi:hypothetical protein